MPDPLSHSSAFIALRERFIDELTDADRARLAGLLGPPRPGPKAPPSEGALDFIFAFADLDREDQRRFRVWVRKYVNRWGQIPQLYSQRLGSPYRGGEKP